MSNVIRFPDKQENDNPPIELLLAWTKTRHKQSIIIGYDNGEPYVTLADPDNLISALELLDIAKEFLLEEDEENG